MRAPAPDVRPGPHPDAGVDEPLEVLAAEVKPRLRGWLHAATAPLALAAGLVLILTAPTSTGVIGGIFFVSGAVLLFGTSGIYHRGTWGPRGEGVLRRLDHANIYVFIAASYTPLALHLLSGSSRVLLLSLIWGAALAGLLFRTCWLSAPRWLYTMLYLVMSWSAVGWMPAFYRSGGLAVLLLILGGGVFYSGGAVVYGRKRPNPSPRWFGFHEIFHACTVIGFGCHFVAIAMITYAAG